MKSELKNLLQLLVKKPVCNEIRFLSSDFLKNFNMLTGEIQIVFTISKLTALFYS